MSKILLSALILLLTNAGAAPAPPLSVNDFDAKTHVIRWDRDEIQGTVLIFMSSVCPCSQSHEKKIVELIRRYPQFQFIGVHSNNEEDLTFAKAHFKNSSIPFLAFANDREQILANRFGALKTPHAFVVDRSGQTVYRGGVDNSHDAGKASTDYLENALRDVIAGRPVKLAETKPLGCVISR